MSQIPLLLSGEKHRSAEIEIQSAADITIGMVQKKPPTRLILKRKVKVDGFANSVCCYENITYVARSMKIARVFPDWSVDKSFITCSGYINSIKASKDTLFILVQSEPQQIQVYDMCGKLIRKWNISVNCGNNGSRLAIMHNQLYALDASTQNVLLYSFDGCLLKTIHCDLISTDDIRISFNGCGRTNLVVASSTGTVFTLNHQTGQVIHTSRHRLRDTAVASLDDHTVLLAGSSYFEITRPITVRMLDMKSGEFERGITSSITICT